MSLDSLRNQIDEIDQEIARLLSRRLDVSRAIGEEKKKTGTSVENKNRELVVLENVTSFAEGDNEKSNAIRQIYQTIFDTSKAVQSNENNLKLGLLGRKLGYSVSDKIHKSICNCTYSYFEREPNELDEFFKDRTKFDGINVTIPYKQDVIKYLDEIDDTAKEIGAVNTIVNKNGKLIGYNTDAFGFEVLLKTSGITVENKNCLVLGSGGASKAVCYVLNKLCAGKVTVISRKGENNYENLDKSAEIIVNCTPVGMDGNEDKALVNVKDFAKLTSAVDIVYSPMKTRFLQEAKMVNLKTAGGLMMLVAQGVYANFLFRGKDIDNAEIVNTSYKFFSQLITEKNIVLIGMPGSGKTTIGLEIARKLNKKFIDTDILITEKEGKKPSVILKEQGEDAFREIEKACIKSLSTETNAVVATGGGAVTREENYYELSKNALVVYLDTPIEKLNRSDRPLSSGDKIYKIYEDRKALYEKWADVRISL